jgi:hypothetical protein
MLRATRTPLPFGLKAFVEHHDARDIGVLHVYSPQDVYVDVLDNARFFETVLGTRPLHFMSAPKEVTMIIAKLKRFRATKSEV